MVLASTGAGTFGDTTLSTTNVSLTGSAYRYAAPNTITTPVTLGNVHVGGTFGTSALTITNSAANDGFSEGLNGSVASTSGAASASGSFSNVIGTSTAISVGLGGNANTGSAGAKSGTVGIGLVSNGTNSGLGDRPQPARACRCSAACIVIAAPSTIITPVTLANVRVGGTFGTSALTIINSAAMVDLAKV